MYGLTSRVQGWHKRFRAHPEHGRRSLCRPATVGMSTNGCQHSSLEDTPPGAAACWHSSSQAKKDLEHHHILPCTRGSAAVNDTRAPCAWTATVTRMLNACVGGLAACAWLLKAAQMPTIVCTSLISQHNDYASGYLQPGQHLAQCVSTVCIRWSSYSRQLSPCQGHPWAVIGHLNTGGCGTHPGSHQLQLPAE
jgi:hypothetical protein